jgi:hypothetical protein
MDGHDRAPIQMLDIDDRGMNRMVWRTHPVFALRFAMARRFTVDDFWLPLARSLGQCMGYGGVRVGGHRSHGPERKAPM